ncbi:hypothetical protein T484DRAFT_1805932, partial [Baffinella frigidus]
ETNLRAAFEASISSDEDDRLGDIYSILKRHKHGWDGMSTLDARQLGPADPMSDDAEKVPVVCVCVQGGPGSIQTVLDSVKIGTPALLVRGSGKAADLLADATLLQFAEGHCDMKHTKYLTVSAMTREQKIFHAFIEFLHAQSVKAEHADLQEAESGNDQPADLRLSSTADLLESEILKEQPEALEGLAEAQAEAKIQAKIAEAKISLWDYSPLIPIFTLFRERLATFLAADGPVYMAVRNAGEKDLLDKMLLEKIYNQEAPYNVGEENVEVAVFGVRLSLLVKAYGLPSLTKGNLELVSTSLFVATFQKSWVYDLNDENPDAVDFDESLLRCLLNGLGWENNWKLLWQKLELAVRWNRLSVLEIILKKTHLKSLQKKKAIQKAFHLALTLDRVDAVQKLLGFQADIAQYEFDPKRLLFLDDDNAKSDLGDHPFRIEKLRTDKTHNKSKL